MYNLRNIHSYCKSHSSLLGPQLNMCCRKLKVVLCYVVLISVEISRPIQISESTNMGQCWYLVIEGTKDSSRKKRRHKKRTCIVEETAAMSCRRFEIGYTHEIKLYILLLLIMIILTIFICHAQNRSPL